MAKFKKVRMHKDEEKINATLEKDKETVIMLKEYFVKVTSECEALMGNTLTDDQKMEMLDNGFDPVMNLLRKQFQFKNATDEFNLQALGKDISKAKQISNDLKNSYQSSGTTLVNGEFVFPADRKKVIIEANSIYTENEKQNEAFEHASKLSDLINEGFNRGYSKSYDNGPICSSFKIVHSPIGSSGFKPNLRYILNIHQDGSQAGW